MVTIKVSSNSLNPLRSISVGRASAFAALLVGIDAEIENVKIHFSTPGDAVANAVECLSVPGGEWKCFANGLFFPREGKAVYHVTGELNGESIYLGGGTLFVTASVMNAVDTPIIPPDTYIRNPATGLWHRLTVEVSATGTITPIIESEGITR